MNNKELLDNAKWILDKNLAWVSAAEVKVGVIVAIDTAMLGALTAIYAADTSCHSLWAILFTSVALFFGVAGIIFCALAVFPKVIGPDSHIFAAKIASHKPDEYESSFIALNHEAILKDCIAQIHRNAEIACVKFAHVRSSMIVSCVALPFWVVAILLLVGE